MTETGGTAQNPKRVLLVRLGSLGDIIHGLPALVSLKAHFPRWEVDWLVERRWSDLLRDNPCLARLIEVDTFRWRKAPLAPATWREFRAAIRLLRERNYDYAIDLQGALKSALASRLSGAVEVIGFDRGDDRQWLREPAAGILYTRRIQPPATHVVDANLGLVTALGVRQPVMAFPLPAGDPMEVPAELRHQECWVINPGAGWGAKQWPASRYAELCDQVAIRYGLPAVINCGPGELGLAAEVSHRCGKARPTVYSGGLGGLIALLRKARLIVAPDTGPLHLAAALGVPTVALFGPTDPSRNGPRGNLTMNLRALSAETSHSRSAKPTGAMEEIRLSQVLEAVEKLLGEPNHRSRPVDCLTT